MATDYGNANFGDLKIKLTSQASHRCNPSRPNQWAAIGVVESGRHENDYGVLGNVEAGDECVVIYDFSEDEVTAAGENANGLPWDDGHIFAVQPR